MYRYQLTSQDRVDSALKHLEDYLLEKERWVITRDGDDRNAVSNCNLLREQVSWIQRKIHDRNETLNHYLSNYKELSVIQTIFLLNGFNPHTLDSDCFNEFSINQDSLLSYFLISKTPVGRKVIKDFDTDSKVSVDKLIRWSSSKGFIFDQNNRAIDEDLAVKLHTLLGGKGLIESGDIQQLWVWKNTDTLLAYLAQKLIKHQVLPYHHPWKVLESYIAQQGVKRLSKIEISNDKYPNDYRLVDSVVEDLSS
ncbi:MAG: hypothetical protein HOB74_03865 [Candidatus Pacebacteria bacterium]|jgi:hypothetical protein|nr:hypothetical protein [Candidatus Paceibacterota bacterium]